MQILMNILVIFETFILKHLIYFEHSLTSMHQRMLQTPLSYFTTIAQII